MQVFADRCRQRIAELGLTDAEVARRLRITERRFGHYVTPRPKTGKLTEPNLQMVVNIARVLETHPNYLLGVSDEPELKSLQDSERIQRLEADIARLSETVNKMSR